MSHQMNEALQRELKAYKIKHLAEVQFKAGREQDIQRLLDQAESLIQEKIRYTRDVSGIEEDLSRVFRACLRADDLPSALRMAQMLVGLNQLGQWLTEEAIGSLLPYLDLHSALGREIQLALAAVPTETGRVESLTGFCQPGLPADTLSWLFSEFNRARERADPSAQRGFLAAMAKISEGTIDDILALTRASGLDAELVGAIIGRLDPLCRETQIAPETVFNDIFAGIDEDLDAYLAAADALAGLGHRESAIYGLTLLGQKVPAGLKEADPCRVLAALAYAHKRQGQDSTARELAQQALARAPEGFPEKSSNKIERYDNYYLQVDAAIRLARATAPFTSLWIEALPLVHELAGLATDRVYRATALAGFLKLTPSIADRAERYRWLEETLADIQALVDELNRDEDRDELDEARDQFLELFGYGQSPKDEAVERLEDAFFGTIRDISALLPPGDGGIETLSTILLTGSQVHLCGTIGKRGRAPFFKRALPELASSGDERAMMWSLGLYIRLVENQGRLTNRSLDPIEPTLTALARHADQLQLRAILAEIFDALDETWCQGRPKVRAVLIILFCRAMATAERLDPLLHFDQLLHAWHRQLEPEERDAVLVIWAGSLLALGAQQVGEQMLEGSLVGYEAGGDSAELPASLRHTLAAELIDAGATEEGAALIRPDLVSQINFDDIETAADQLRLARNLLRAGCDGHEARQLMLRTAQAFRQRRDRLGDDWEKLILNTFHDIDDPILLHELLDRAEEQLVDAAHEDALMAARWFALLALSASGNLEAALNAWGDVKVWKPQRQLAAVRQQIVALIRDAGPGGANRAPLLEALGQNMEAIEEDKIFSAAASLLPALVSPSSQDLAIDALHLSYQAADRKSRDPGGSIITSGFWDCWQRIQNKLLVIGSPPIIRPCLEKVIAIYEDNERAIPVSVLNILDKLDDSDWLGHFLERVLRLTPYLSIWFHRVEMVTAVMRQAESKLAALHWKELIDLGIALVDVEREIDAKRDMLRELLLSAARFPAPWAITHLLPELSERLISTREEVDERRLLLAETYHMLTGADLSRSHHGQSFLADLRRRLLRSGQPRDPALRMRWATELFPTPLHDLASAVAERLLKDLPGFEPTEALVGAFSGLLNAVIPGWPGEEIDRRYQILAGWARGLPTVQGVEVPVDLRYGAFEALFSTTAGLEPNWRSELQLWLLPQMLRISTRLAREQRHRAQDLPVIRWHVNRLLDTYGDEDEDEGPGWEFLKKDTPLDQILWQIDYYRWAQPGNDDQVVAVFFCELLDRYMGEPLTMMESILAKVVENCSHPGLSQQLQMLLEKHYQPEGIPVFNEPLGDSDLWLLARVPGERWHESLRHFEVAYRYVRDTLLEWVEKCANQDPALAGRAIIFASAACGNEQPEELPNLWLDIATTTAPVPDPIRQLLMEQIVRTGSPGTPASSGTFKSK